MIRILFVCHGNICRSPMAEFIFNDICKERGLDSMFIAQSAATSTEELGNPVYPPAKKILMKHNISSDGKFSRRVNKSDYENFDMIVCMDRRNVTNLMPLIGEDRDGKTSLLMNFAGISRDVADPWYTGDFETTYNDIFLGVNALIEKLLKG